MSKTVEMYADGYLISDIMDELLFDTEEEVINELLKFKYESRISSSTKRLNLNDEFKDVIVRRYESGFSIYSISKDLHMGKSTIHGILKKAGVTIHQKGNERSKYYVKIDWDRFDCCPNCNSKKDVRFLGLHHESEYKNGIQNHSYCLNCGTEWYKTGKEVRKILWHEIS